MRRFEDFGYVEGKNMLIEFRSAEGKYDRLPELAAELVRQNVDVIVAAGTPPIRAAKQATETVTIAPSILLRADRVIE